MHEEWGYEEALHEELNDDEALARALAESMGQEVPQVPTSSSLGISGMGLNRPPAF
jgi:hypothetical protein